MATSRELGAKILQRAAEIDARESGASNLGQLRAAAQEAGISLDAFDQAALELTQSGASTVGEGPRRFRLHRPAVSDRFILPLAFGSATTAVGLLIAGFNGLLDDSGSFLVGALVALIGVLVGLTVRRDAEARPGPTATSSDQDPA